MAFLGAQLNTSYASMKSLHSGWARTPPPGCAISGVISIMLSDPAHMQPNSWPRTKGEFPHRLLRFSYSIPFLCLFVLQTSAVLAPPNSISAFYLSETFVAFVLFPPCVRREPSHWKWGSHGSYLIFLFSEGL